MKTMRLTTSVLTCLFLCVITAFAEPVATVSSPDLRLKVCFDFIADKPVYSVDFIGNKVIENSPLGFVANVGDFTQNITFEKSAVEHVEYDYSVPTIKKSNVHVNANQLVVTLKNKQGHRFEVEFMVSNNDVAFRYRIPNLKDKKNGQKYSIRIMKEATGFDLPAGTKTFLSPQSDAMIGWKGSKPSYEEEYLFDEPMQTRSKYGHGYTFPCLFHLNPGVAGKEGWVLISETGNDSRYCACRLSDMKGDGLYTVEFPMVEENNGNGTPEPAFALPGKTPWRTITIADNLKPIVETTVAWDFVEPRFKSAHNYKYGKSTWSWIVWQDDAICTPDLRQYVDLAKAMGYPYTLVDAGWDVNMGIDGTADLVRYARSQGVEVFLWYSSSGWWNDITQSPINVMCDAIARKQYMKWMQEIGVKGIKVDFFGGDKQETMRIYEQILSDADDFGLMVIFHGCTLPRGWERMYPNYVGSEAVLASENLYFDQHFCDVEAQNTALHPFCRNTVASMEFGGCFMNRHIHRGNKGGNTRKTTDCHELATTVLFQNPIQNFAITPENLNPSIAPDKNYDFNAPGAIAPLLSMDFLKQVPTVWDETVFVDGYPGKYCVLARRSGQTWYIAGNNATGKTLNLTLSLPMLTKGTVATLYSDNLRNREPQKSEMKISNPAKVKVSMADQGGFVIVK